MFSNLEESRIPPGDATEGTQIAENEMRSSDRAVVGASRGNDSIDLVAARYRAYGGFLEFVTDHFRDRSLGISRRGPDWPNGTSDYSFMIVAA